MKAIGTTQDHFTRKIGFSKRGHAYLISSKNVNPLKR